MASPNANTRSEDDLKFSVDDNETVHTYDSSFDSFNIIGIEIPDEKDHLEMFPDPQHPSALAFKDEKPSDVSPVWSPNALKNVINQS